MYNAIVLSLFAGGMIGLIGGGVGMLWNSSYGSIQDFELSFGIGCAGLAMVAVAVMMIIAAARSL